ncbi:MAG: hypothetical protein DWQ05_19330 [Calditrichaeota bacterium]|nr:MAG: hypothetical protein DWQ05_19330 [Calditrichota bacterium]
MHLSHKKERKLKKSIILLFAFIIFILPSLQAQKGPYVNMGMSLAKFRTEGGKSKPGFLFGVGRNFFPVKNFNGFVGLELGYAQLITALENKRLLIWVDESGAVIVAGDIKPNISFIDLTLKTGYRLPEYKSVNLSLYVAPFLALPIKRGTDGSVTEHYLFGPDELDNLEYDYVRKDEYEAMVLQNGIQYGMTFEYRQFALSISYSHASTKIEGFTTHDIKDKLDSMQVLLLYSF